MSKARWLGVSMVVSAGIGATLLLVDDSGTAASSTYTRRPEFKVWVALIVVIFASLPFVWDVGITVIKRLGARVETVSRRYWLWGIGFVVVSVVLLSEGSRESGHTSPLAYGGGRAAAIYVVTLIGAGPCLVAIWECGRAATLLAGDVGGKLTHLMDVQSCLRTAFAPLGALVSASVLAAGAHRQAVNAVAAAGDKMPAEDVLLLGLFLSALLLVNFYPSFQTVRNVASDFLDETLPIVAPPTPGWRRRIRERKDLAGLLGLDAKLSDVISSTLFVAGPLATGAISLLLPHSSG